MDMPSISDRRGGMGRGGGDHLSMPAFSVDAALAIPSEDVSCRADSLTSGQPHLDAENSGEPSTPPLHVPPLWLGHQAVASSATTVDASVTTIRIP